MFLLRFPVVLRSDRVHFPGFSGLMVALKPTISVAALPGIFDLPNLKLPPGKLTQHGHGSRRETTTVCPDVSSRLTSEFISLYPPII